MSVTIFKIIYPYFKELRRYQRNNSIIILVIFNLIYLYYEELEKCFFFPSNIIYKKYFYFIKTLKNILSFSLMNMFLKSSF